MGLGWIDVSDITIEALFLLEKHHIPDRCRPPCPFVRRKTGTRTTVSYPGGDHRRHDRTKTRTRYHQPDRFSAHLVITDGNRQ